MTMLEKIARAIWQENKPDMAPGYDDLDDLDQGRVKMIARACLQAMREPAEGMIRACDEMTGGFRMQTLSDDKIKSLWDDMIDYAIKEESH